MLLKHSDFFLATADSENKSRKSLSKRSILEKLKSYKTKNGNSTIDDSTNAEDVNKSKAIQIEDSNDERPTTVKIAEESEDKEQITHSEQAGSSK